MEKSCKRSKRINLKSLRENQKSLKNKRNKKKDIQQLNMKENQKLNNQK